MINDVFLQQRHTAHQHPSIKMTEVTKKCHLVNKTDTRPTKRTESHQEVPPSQQTDTRPTIRNRSCQERTPSNTQSTNQQNPTNIKQHPPIAPPPGPQPTREPVPPLRVKVSAGGTPPSPLRATTPVQEAAVSSLRVNTKNHQQIQWAATVDINHRPVQLVKQSQKKGPPQEHYLTEVQRYLQRSKWLKKADHSAVVRVC